MTTKCKACGNTSRNLTFVVTARLQAARILSTNAMLETMTLPFLWA